MSEVNERRARVVASDVQGRGSRPSVRPRIRPWLVESDQITGPFEAERSPQALTPTLDLASSTDTDPLALCE